MTESAKLTTRLNKYISDSGICSRREADRFIDQGNVYINGKRATIGDRVSSGDSVKVNGTLIEPREADNFLFIALNKPVGIVSTTEASEPDNIVDFVRHTKRIFPIGRLDKDSQGLIFLTNNGDLVNKILRAGNNHEKEYLVTVDKNITDEFIRGMGAGVPILGTMTKKCKVSKERNNVFRITLVQGLNRQIRRMCEYFGYDVIKLERIRIMNISLKGLPEGEWRDLKEQELTTLLKACEGSSSEAQHDKPASRQSTKKSNSSASSKKSGKYDKKPQGKGGSRSSQSGSSQSGNSQSGNYKSNGSKSGSASGNSRGKTNKNGKPQQNGKPQHNGKPNNSGKASNKNRNKSKKKNANKLTKSSWR